MRKVRFVTVNVKSQISPKGILFISYHYPPDSQIGAKRAARLAKCLMENGWRAGVLTVKDRFYERLDRSYDVPGAAVYRTEMFQSIRFLLPRLKRTLTRLKSGYGHAEGAASAGSARAGGGEAPAAVSGTSRRLRSWIRRFVFSMIWLPDDRQGWVPFGLFRCLRLLAAYPIVYSSSPPESTHLIPLLASYCTRRLAWVAEFRDPWTTVPKPAFARTKLGDWLEEKWEAAVIARSARVVVVTEAMKRDLAGKYPQHADRIRVYSNGFDRDEFSQLKDSASARSEGTTTFAYAGQFDYGRSPRTFLQALSELIDGGALARGKVRVPLMSNTHVGGESIEQMARERGLEDVVQCIGYVPYDRCLEEMSRADVLLLFSIDQPLQVPAKLYEYLALNKRILSLSTGGITAELIDRTGSGVNVKPDDLEGMKKAIMALVSGEGPSRNELEIAKFEIRSIVGALSEDLKGLIKDG